MGRPYVCVHTRTMDSVPGLLHLWGIAFFQLQSSEPPKGELPTDLPAVTLFVPCFLRREHAYSR